MFSVGQVELLKVNLTALWGPYDWVPTGFNAQTYSQQLTHYRSAFYPGPWGPGVSTPACVSAERGSCIHLSASPIWEQPCVLHPPLSGPNTSC